MSTAPSLAAFAFAVATLAPIGASAERNAPSDIALSFAVNNTLATVFHEFGHAAIDLFQLPVLGQEEDAADSFATLEVIRSFEAEDAMLILLDMADAQLIAHDEAEENGLIDYYGAHDLEAQRAYRAICYLYGTDPDAFSDAADWADLPRDRKDSCEYDADLAWSSWDQMLDPHMRAQGASAKGIQVVFKRGRSRDLLKDSLVLQDIAASMSAAFAWPEPLQITARKCGEANAYYDPQALEIVFCYEFFDEYLRVGAGLE